MDWYMLIAPIAASIAAIASWYSIYTQGRRYKKNKEPIIVPGLKNIETKINGILSDWDSDEEINEAFSNTTFPLWNYGNTSVFNVKYCYYIENLEGYIEEAESILEDSHRVAFLRADNKDFEWQLGVSDYKKEDYEQTLVNLFNIAPFIRSAGVIKSNESIEINLPSYFIVLVNDYHLNRIVYRNQNTPKVPVLRLKVIYDDINFTTFEQSYLLTLSYAAKHSREKLRTNFECEKIGKKKKYKNESIKQMDKHREFRRAKKW